MSELVRIKEASEILAPASLSQIRAMAKRGDITGAKMGGTWFFVRQTLVDWRDALLQGHSLAVTPGQIADQKRKRETLRVTRRNKAARKPVAK